MDVHLKTTLLGEVFYKWIRSRYENYSFLKYLLEHLHITSQTLFREVKCGN